MLLYRDPPQPCDTSQLLTRLYTKQHFPGESMDINLLGVTCTTSGLLTSSLPCVFFRDNGESRRQQPATTGGHRFSVLEAVCRLRGQNRRPFPPLHHGQLLAQPMPQVLLLPGPAGRNRHVVLHKKRHDPL